MVVKNWQEPLQAEEGMGNVFFFLLLKHFSVIKQYVSLDIISVHGYVLRPEKVTQAKKFLGFKAAKLTARPIDILSD